MADPDCQHSEPFAFGQDLDSDQLAWLALFLTPRIGVDGSQVWPIDELSTDPDALGPTA